ncbi:MAG: hypothetical protein Phyf2KO_12740 [Phycisphaerales bacterium]
MKTFAALVAAGVATSASAQTELCILVAPTGNGDEWAITAELFNPTGTVLATIADLGFVMNGTNISNFSYNSAFDSDFFGPATVNVSASQVDFLGGNTLPPLNNAAGPDSTNPLAIATFNADDVASLSLVGQVTGAYTGVPFPIILTYQDAQGNAGDTPYEIKIVPAPASAALLGLGGLAAARRRR